MQRLIERQALRGAAEELRSDLQFLRAAAVSRGQPLWLSTTQNALGGSCYVIYAGVKGDCSCLPSGSTACAAGAQVLKTVGFDAGGNVQLQRASTFGIEPVRGAATPTATLTLFNRAGDAVRQIVNVMGRVRTCSPDALVPGYSAC